MVDKKRINWNNEKSEVRVYQETDNTITMSDDRATITSDTWYDLQNMR